MNFWKFKIDTFNIWLYIGIIVVIFLLSNILRRKVKFIRNSLLPTAIIAGIVILVLKSVGAFNFIFSKEDIGDLNILMESITYHTLGLGVIALALKSDDRVKSKDSNRDILNAGLITVNTYLIQAIFGVLIVLLLGFTFVKGLFPASGLLLPLGFGQGSGQALNFGSMFEETYGFTGGASFGLMIATIGFLVACIIGVIHINVMRKRGVIKINEPSLFESKEIIASPNEVPSTDAVDRMSIQIGLILFVYFITFLVMYGVEMLPIGNFGTNTVKPLVWGFNFLIGSLLAVLLKVIIKKLRKTDLMTRDYPNNYLLNRISGFMFDLMIITGTAAINIEVLKELIIPLIILGLVGALVTYFYVKKTSYKMFPNYKEEAFVSMFGLLTGTTSTGMILLREVDSKFETPAANNLIYQSFYAIAFGFPLFLLLGIAPKGLNFTLISLGIILVMFVALNIVLYRKEIFNKK